MAEGGGGKEVKGDLRDSKYVILNIKTKSKFSLGLDDR